MAAACLQDVLSFRRGAGPACFGVWSPALGLLPGILLHFGGLGSSCQGLTSSLAFLHKFWGIALMVIVWNVLVSPAVCLFSDL